MIPKKVKLVLSKLKITGVVNGYTTMVGPQSQAAFTGWNSKGQPIVVLYKLKGKDWSLTPH